MSKIKTQLAAVAFALLAVGGTAYAGRGGSSARIRAAVSTGSVDAIIAEVERAEFLICEECGDIMTALLDHEQYKVRQVAGWWFAKRPTIKDMMIGQMTDDLGSSTAKAVRNAADFLGTVKAYGSIPALHAAYGAQADVEARRHIIKAVGRMASQQGNALIVAGLSDADASVRIEAAKWYRDVRRQTNATPLFPLLGDGDALVRATAAASIGGLKGAGARVQLEQLVASDTDPAVRRNAAWALGQIGDRASRPVLEAARQDASGLVRRTASAALTLLR